MKVMSMQWRLASGFIPFLAMTTALAPAVCHDRQSRLRQDVSSPSHMLTTQRLRFH